MSTTVAQLAAEIDTELDRVTADPVSVLEAGGGSATFLRGFDRRFRFTTIDISQEQLDRNNYAAEKILGDLETLDYGTRRFHLVMCWDVLEHLAAPDRALAKMLAAIPTGGVIVIKGPLPDSLKGLMTRWSPHPMHVLFYKSVLGKADAGKPGHAPFRAELKAEASPEILTQMLVNEGFVVVAQSRFITNQIIRLKEKALPAYHAFRWLSRCILALSRGRYGGFESDFYLLARRMTGARPSSTR